MVKNSLKRIYLTFCYIFLYLPIILLFIYSFNESKYMNKFTNFTLKWYIELFKDKSILSAFYQTLIICFIATIFALIIGTLGAWSIYKTNNRKLKSYFLNTTYIPLVLPDIVIAIGMIILFVFFNLNFGYFTIIMSHIIFNVPYVVFAILPKLITFDDNLLDSAMDLGANPFCIFTKIVFPQLIPNLIAAALIAFTLSLDDFTISYFTSGSGVMTLSVKIYSMTKRGISPKINALSTLMFAIIILISIFTYIVKHTNSIKQKK